VKFKKFVSAEFGHSENDTISKLKKNERTLIRLGRQKCAGIRSDGGDDSDVGGGGL